MASSLHRAGHSMGTVDRPEPAAALGRVTNHSERFLQEAQARRLWDSFAPVQTLVWARGAHWSGRRSWPLARGWGLDARVREPGTVAGVAPLARLLGRLGARCPRGRCPELSTRADSELHVDLAEMPFDGAGAQEELCSDLRIRDHRARVGQSALLAV